MEKEKINFYKAQLHLLGIETNYRDRILLSYKISKHNTASCVLAFHDDCIYRVYGGTYVELREEELNEIIQKYVEAKGRYAD